MPSTPIRPRCAGSRRGSVSNSSTASARTWLGLSHRDLHDKQLMYSADSDTPGLLDFDTAALAEPAWDVANLAVHLELRRDQRVLDDAAVRVAESAIGDVVRELDVPEDRLWVYLELHPASAGLRGVARTDAPRNQHLGRVAGTRRAPSPTCLSGCAPFALVRPSLRSWPLPRWASAVVVMRPTTTRAPLCGRRPQSRARVWSATTATPVTHALRSSRPTLPTVIPERSPNAAGMMMVLLAAADRRAQHPRPSTPCVRSGCGRVVGAATVEGDRPQPRYLGTGIAAIPGIGPVGFLPGADRGDAARSDPRSAPLDSPSCSSWRPPP